MTGKFSRWLLNSESPLDKAGIAALSEETLDRAERSPEAFAALESQREQKRLSAWEEEHRLYLRVHEWSFTSGLKLLKHIYRFLAVLIGGGIIFSLLWTVSALPPLGAANNPLNNEVSRRYLEDGPAETGALNMVTGMILDYRAFDTFGESTVLFTAACAVLLLMKLNDCANGQPTKTWLEAEYDDRHHEPKNDQILQFAARALVPVVLLFGLYVIANGHLSPGGGFSGGAIMGAGLILYLNAFGFAKTERFMTFNTFRWITFLSLLTYAGLKSYSFYTGANHLESGVSAGIPGAIFSAGFILPLNLCVGLIVMCTMYAFYTLFRKGGI
ncbi:MAG: MnhB domain-containing protein [Eubacteriales bacterium]|nr:MnhB domain-containing protein [Eubacteriales bacterium]